MSSDFDNEFNRRSDGDPRLRRLDRLAWFLDNSIPLPGGYRVGVDGLIGLVPGIGDAVGALLSSYIIAEAARGGASTSVVLRMALNVLVEAFVGLVPVLGDLFDFGFKANARNMRLVREHVSAPVRTRRTSRVVVALVAIAAGAIAFALLFVAYAVLRWAWSVIAGA